MSAFRAGLAWSETARNMVAAPVRSAALCAVAAIIGALVVVVTARESVSIQDRYYASMDAGAAGFVVSSGNSASGVDAARCDALSAIPGVRSAGGIVAQTEVVFANRPDSRYLLLSVTQGFVDFMWPASLNPRHATPPGVPIVTEGDSVLIGSQAALDLGLGPDTTVGYLEATAGTSVSTDVFGVLPPSLREGVADVRVVSLVAPVGRVQECLVEAYPDTRQAVEELLLGWFPVADEPVTQSFRTEDQLGPPVSDFDGRVSKLFWLVAFGVDLILVLTMWWARRAEFALYQLLGMNRKGLALALVFEALWYVWVPALAGIFVGLAGVRSLLVGDVPYLVATDVYLFMSCLPLIPLLGLAFRGTGSVLLELKGQ